MESVPFSGGLEISRLFYEEVVRPILAAQWPGLAYAAALIGPGSEVLGYDTPISTDHNWGPRVLLFLAPEAVGELGPAIGEALSRHVPPRFRGYATHFGPPDAAGTRVTAAHAGGPIAHKVTIQTVGDFFQEHLGIDVRRPLRPVDWLTIPQQQLLAVTAGRVFHDGLGTLEPIRARLVYYPPDVWRTLLAAQWARIGEQEAFVGRTGDVGDELGSRLVAGGLVHDLMRLAFLMARRYAPYAKWFGTAFARLACAPVLTPLLDTVLAAADWRTRETALGRAYMHVAAQHNALGLTPPLAAVVSNYHTRPYQVIHAERYAAALRASIADPEVGALGAAIGGVDQWVDSTAVLAHPARYRRLGGLYE